MLSNSGKDERNKYNSGKAGDQTGQEWNIIPFYKRPWNLMLRYEGERCEEVRALIAALAEEAALNNNIGYDQYQRTTFWQELEKSGYHPSNINNPCESDCSAGAIAIIKAVGYLLNIDPIKRINVNGYSGNIKPILESCGFKSYTDSKYLNSDDYLLEGDILVYIGHHVAINLDNGKCVNNTSSQSSTLSKFKLGWNKNPVGWWFADGEDSYLKDQWQVINHHWYYFNSQGYILKGLNKVNNKLYYFTEEGPLEGALMKSSNDGYLVEWYID